MSYLGADDSTPAKWIAERASTAARQRAHYNVQITPRQLADLHINASSFPGYSGSGAGGVGDIPQLVAPVLGRYGYLGKTPANVAASNKQMSDAAKNIKKNLKPISTKHVTMKNGKISATAAVGPGSSLWSDMNKEAAKFTQMFSGVVNASPLSNVLKKKLIKQPLDFFFDLFDPIEDMIGRVVDRTMKKHGSKQNYFGKMINISRVQPGDSKFDASTQNFTLRLRTIQAFIVLFFTKPLELAAEMAQEGFNIVGDIANAIGKTAGDVVKSISEQTGVIVKGAGEAAQAAGKAAGEAAQNIAKTAQNVMSFLNPFDGFSAVGGIGHYVTGDGLGEPVTIVGGTTAVAGTAATGIGVFEIVNWILEGLKAVSPIATAAIQSAGGAGAPGGAVPTPPAEKSFTDTLFDSEAGIAGIPPVALIGGAAALAAVLYFRRK